MDGEARPFPEGRPDLSLESWGLTWEEGRQCFLTPPQHLGKNQGGEVHLRPDATSPPAQHRCPSACAASPSREQVARTPLVSPAGEQLLPRGEAETLLYRETPLLLRAESHLPAITETSSVSGRLFPLFQYNKLTSVHLTTQKTYKHTR